MCAWTERGRNTHWHQSDSSGWAKEGVQGLQKPKYLLVVCYRYLVLVTLLLRIFYKQPTIESDDKVVKAGPNTRPGMYSTGQDRTGQSMIGGQDRAETVWEKRFLVMAYHDTNSNSQG